MPYNIVSCKGFIQPGEVAGWFVGGDCLKAKLALVFLFFVVAVFRKWVFEMFELPYNFWVGAVPGLVLGFLITISIFGSVKVAVVVGLLASLILGVVAGIFIQDSGGGE